MTEREFSAEITRSLNRDLVWNYKIPDIGKVLKPFDRVINYYGKFVAIEEKLCKSPTFNFKKISSHQLTNLLKCGGYLLINFRFKNKKYGRVNTAFLIPARHIYAMMERGERSFKYQEIVFNPIKVVSWHKGKWDLADTLSEIYFGGEPCEKSFFF